ncbi:MAG: hypothetical protein AB7U97_00175 [Pirellulales bacterium]
MVDLMDALRKSIGAGAAAATEAPKADAYERRLRKLSLVIAVIPSQN